MIEIKGIILHGGHGTRLRPLTHTGPKQLLPIANKPMSQYCLESLVEANITDISIIIGGPASSKVSDYYGDGTKFGAKVSYVYQDQPRGIAHAIRLCKDFVGKEKFVVFLGDNILLRTISDFVKDFEKSNSDATILLCEVDNPIQFGIADINPDGSIKKIMEKPKNPPTNLAVTGIYFLTPKIFDVIDRLKPSWRNEYEITDSLQMLLEEGNRITYYRVTDYWKDTGTPNDIIHANRVVLENMKSRLEGIIEKGAEVTGNVIVGERTVIKAGAKIEGPVIIGKDCVIDRDAYIGPNTSIGDNSKISKCRIQDSIIMKGCNIDAKTNIAASIIAFNSEITQNNKEYKILLLGEGTKISL